MFDEFEPIESPVIETGNGRCGYVILPSMLCGCNPSKFGGYEYCNKDKCPLCKGENE